MKDIPASVLFSTLQGHSSPKKSRKVVLQGNPDSIRWLTQRQLKQALNAAGRARGLARRAIAIANRRRELIPPRLPCMRRFLEHFGLPNLGLHYEVPACLISRPDKFIYEIWLGFEPFCSFTDPVEAQASCASLIANGCPTAEVQQRAMR